MLKEYILENMENARIRVIGVMKNYNQICETEKKIEEKINTLQNDKNIDFEIFSPRMEEKSIRAKMNDYYEELHKIQEKKEKANRLNWMELRKKWKNFELWLLN